MDTTLGKRIMAERKKLGLTQDKLAETLGVTAQAVSKWENDQSCPDITMLPRLAALFGITVDALLGLEPPKAVEAEVVTQPEEQRNNWEMHYDSGRKPRIWFAIWVLLIGVLMLVNYARHSSFSVGLWDMAWPSALMLFGLSGLYPKFSLFRLGCALFGAYSLLENMSFTCWGLSHRFLMIVALLLFGLSLLVDALRKPKDRQFSITHNGKHIRNSECSYGTDCFDCQLSFGEETHRIDLKVLREGDASVSFGELTVDLSGCEAIAPNCSIDADCSFGRLTLRIPRRFRAEGDKSTAFAALDIQGQPDAEPEGIIFVDASVSFGEITIDYI